MITVHIESLANGGDGVSHLDDGRVVFVPRAFIGDHVEIEIVRSQKRWARARLISVLVPSEDRIEPGCQHFDRCGGCAFQHVAYEAEFPRKAAAAVEAFARISRHETPPGERIAATSSSGYRIRTRLHAARGRLGYVAPGTHDIFDVEACPVLDPRLNRRLPALRDAVRGQTGEVAIETAGAGEVVVVLNGAFDDGCAHRVLAIEGVRGVRIAPDHTIVGTPTVAASEAIGVDCTVPFSAGRFRQSNASMTPQLRDLVQRRLAGGSALVEYFAGSGSFTFALGAQYDQIQAFELDPAAVALGNQIAAAIGQKHVHFAEADLTRDPPPIAAGHDVLLDPPRTGALELVRWIATSEARRVVYVSCDVGTLARDARVLLDAGFAVDTFDLVDMFPRTAHIEAVATFSRA